ncbi:MAG TPA: TolC family protein [Planctomycetota bacterium]|nr:TolC family protein [Planctomycetota bacterium]
MSLGRLKADLAASREAALKSWQRERAGDDTVRPRIAGELSLEAAQVLAVGNNKQLLATIEEREVAAGRLTEAWSAIYPIAALTGSYRRVDEVSSFSAGPETITIGSLNNYSVDLALRQPVFRGGAIQAGIRAARVYALLADEQIRGAVQGVLFLTRKAYYDVLLAAELVKVSEGDLELARRYLEEVEKKLKAGAAKEFDVLRARVEISNIEAELIERQNALRLAKAVLLRILGVSQGSQVALTGKLAHERVSPELADAVGRAYRQRPELLLAELAIRLQHEAVKATSAGWFPMLDLFWTGTYAKPDPHSMTNIKWNDAWSAGANAAWTLFDGFRTKGRVRQERAKLKMQEIGLLDAEDQVLLEVQQALLSIEDAEKLVASQSANTGRAQEGLRLAQVGYKGGVTTEIEVLDARQALSRTQAIYYRALHAHMMARLALERATGALEPPAEGAQK